MSSAPKTDGFVARGGRWVVIQFALMAAGITLGVMFHGEAWPPGAVWVVSGASLLGLAAIFGLPGVAALRGNRTPFPKPREHSELVQHGIYSRVRHPLYTSVMLAGFGWAVCLKSWPAFVVAVVQLPFFHAKARREESWLCEKFAGYREYMNRVPRFIPGLGSSPAGGRRIGKEFCDDCETGGSVKGRRR